MSVNTKELIIVYKFMLHALLQGQSIRGAEVANAIKIDKVKVKLIVDSLVEQGAIYRDLNKQVKAIYPFSIMATHHRVTNSENNISYANCALDALTIPAIFQSRVNINSRCEACNNPININVNNTEIESNSPRETVVWEQKRTSDCAAKISVCPGTNFFCNKNCALKIHKNKSDLHGNILTLNEAMSRVKTWCSFMMYSKITNLLINEAS